MAWTPGHELKYWRKNGLRKGSHIYKNYFDSFKLAEHSFDGKKVADVGCGPFGGVLIELEKADVYPIDVLADEYNAMKVSSVKIHKGDLSQTLPFDDGFFDYAICTNAIDHIPDMLHGMRELNRILASGGTLFLHVHLRSKEELNKAHVHTLDLKKAEKLAKDAGFEVLQNEKDTDWVNDEADRYATYMILRKA